MPLTNHPISPANPRDKKTKTSSSAKNLKTSNKTEASKSELQEEKLELVEQFEEESKKTTSSTDKKDDNKENIDFRQEFFRLMAEKIKDKDFDVSQAMAVKEELNRIEREAKQRAGEQKESRIDASGVHAISSDEEEVKNQAKKVQTWAVDESAEDEVLDFTEEIPTEFATTESEAGMASDEREDVSSFVEENYFEDENETLDSTDKVVREGKPKSFALYRKIVYRFLFLTIVLLLLASYLYFVKLNIIVHTEKNKVDGSLNFYAYSSSEKINLERALKASISKIEIEEKGTFKSSGEKDTSGEIVGRVKIINNYSKNQPLVATTRLLSSDDKLFRLKNTVNVPAGGSIEVDIYTDSVSEEMAIGPDKFIIPGLWTGVQDKIYAESYQKFEYRKDSKKYVMEKDINTAVEDLKSKIIEQAEIKAKSAIGSGKQYVLSVDPDSFTFNSSKKIGEEADSFDLSLKSFVNVVSFETDEIVKLAKQKLAIESNQSISEVDVNSLNYELVNFDSSKNLAEIKVFFTARTLVGSDDFINKKHLSNLKKNQIEAYLNKIEEIKSYELIFTPNFLKRSPLLVDKISIEYR